MSLPSWERGLKLIRDDDRAVRNRVAPLVGAWIEIGLRRVCWWAGVVAPLVGAWIEIGLRHFRQITQMSLPSWERGLK